MKTIITICVLGIIALTYIGLKNPPIDTHYDNCLDIVGQAIPDPNDTEARAKLLNNC